MGSDPFYFSARLATCRIAQIFDDQATRCDSRTKQDRQEHGAVIEH